MLCFYIIKYLMDTIPLTYQLDRLRVFSVGIDELLYQYVWFDGEYKEVYCHTDALGSIYGLTDDTANIVEYYEYDIYGAPSIYDAVDGQRRSVSAYANRYLFTGREYHTATQLYYYRARWYSPTLGRFLTRDPSMNYIVYTYCANMPTIRSDPLGLQEISSLPTLEELYRKWGKMQYKDLKSKEREYLKDLLKFFDARMKSGKKWLNMSQFIKAYRIEMIIDETRSSSFTSYPTPRMILGAGQSINRQLSDLVHEFVHAYFWFCLSRTERGTPSSHDVAVLVEIASADITGISCDYARKRVKTCTGANPQILSIVQKARDFFCDCICDKIKSRVATAWITYKNYFLFWETGRLTFKFNFKCRMGKYSAKWSIRCKS